MVTLQTVVDDDVAQAVKEAAARDRRSVSEWIALRLEEVLDLPAARLRDDPDELARREAKLRPSSGDSRTERSSHPVKCQHDEVTKEPGAGGGLVKVCRACGKRLLR